MSQTKPNLPELKGLPAVKKARQALLERSHEILEEYRTAIKMAIAHGKYAEGLAAYQWLLDHMPAEEGVRVVDVSVDKQVHADTGPKGPIIQIGVQLGRMPQKALQEPVIDADIREDED